MIVSVCVIIGQFVCLAVTSFIGLKARETRGGSPLVSLTFRAKGVERKLDRGEFFGGVYPKGTQVFGLGYCHLHNQSYGKTNVDDESVMI